MNIVGRVSVLPKLPDSIARLKDLAYNLWWSWTPEAQELYAQLDPGLWDRLNHNPVRFLRNVDQSLLDQASQDQGYVQAYNQVLRRFDSYMAPDAPTWFSAHHDDKQNQVIAYFSAEFGLHEALPIYSGGLGVLSGDHCKEASDLGLPFVCVGFLYPQGYFSQHIDQNGRQQAFYEQMDFADLPVTPALGPDGQRVLINVDLPGRTVYAQIWKIQVGRCTIFMMDTDVIRNAPQDRALSSRLYFGDEETRVAWEMVLGIGGVRALRALGYNPAVWHMNEGHSAFLGLERARELVQGQGLTFNQAVEVVRASSVFTTHTPVPAGNDAFPFELMEKFFWQFWGQLGIDRDHFLAFARQDLAWGPRFSMTVLALRFSGYANGVSELHGHVSRDMWHFLWPDTMVSEAPITHVTNGVHTKTWLVQELRDLYTQYLGENWLEEVDQPSTWARVDAIPDQTLWDVHQDRKQKLVDYVRERVRRQVLRFGEGPARVAEAGKVLNPEALTLGFARRFATYKRATLIFRDRERLLDILNNPQRPVQIIFSGKAHPADEPGQALIEQIFRYSQDPAFAGKIVFLENYDMDVARHLISGVDIWLNTPRRPHEASGTSGQKAALSGVPNFSVLDGWWAEAFDGSNGWAIGEERSYKDQETQDEADAISFYETLENTIVPLFYQRNGAGLPEGWLSLMRQTIRSCAPVFSMRRMVKGYVSDLYLPAGAGGQAVSREHFAQARTLAQWKQQVRQHWHEVHIHVPDFGATESTVNDTLQIQAQVRLGSLKPEDVTVEIVAGREVGNEQLDRIQILPMQQSGSQDGALLYQGQLTPAHSGSLAIGVRVRPVHPYLVHPHATGLNRWAGSA